VLLQEQAVALDRDDPQPAGDLALLWLDLDDEARATGLIESMLRRWPDDVYSNICAATIAAAVGDHATAETHARKVLAVYPRAPALDIAVLRNADLRRGDLVAARARYAAGYPELLKTKDPRVNWENPLLAIDLALVLQRMGDVGSADALLDASERAIRSIPRLGPLGYGIADAQIHALRGDKAKALAALREAEKAGWRGPGWRYYRDLDPNLASIRNEPEFKAVFADIERDMARQRAELAAHPKDAPLDLGASIK
jgi:tetratricopeptide (TPR) repeat protein